MCPYFGLEGGVELREERVLPRQLQDSFLHHGTLDVIVHQNYVLLQNLHSIVLAFSLQLGQQHLECQRHLRVSRSPM